MSAEAGYCVFCGGSKIHTAYSVTDIFGHSRNLCACRDCGTFFYDPQPTGAELEQAYSDDYYGAAETKFHWGLVERLVDHYRQRRAKQIRKLIRSSGSVLDVGCGNGRLLHYLHSMGDFELYGTEMPGNSAKRAMQYQEINLFVGPFSKAVFPPRSFQAITLFHVFEHLPDPAEALERIDQLLKPGGMLIMSFPNIKSVQASLLKSHWLHLDPPRHLFFPDHKALRKLMEEKGYRLMRRKFFSPEQNPAGAVQGLLNLMSGRRDLLFERMKGNKKYLPETSKTTLALHKLFFITAMPFFMLGDVFESLVKRGATVELTFKKESEYGIQ